MVGYGWIHTNPIKSFCMSLYTNKYYLTYLFGSREKESSKMYEGGGTGSPLLRIHFENMWSWLDLVGYAKFRSIALVVWHRFQQRKLIPAKIEKHKKQTHNQNTESPKTTPQDSPEKTTKAKNKSHKKNKQNLESDKFWLSCVLLVCFLSVCSGIVFFKPLYFLCCSAQKPGIQKGSKQTPYSHFWLERKRSQKCMKGRGDRPTPP